MRVLTNKSSYFFHRYTQIFQEYATLLEGHIERLVSECNCTSQEFFEALKRNEDGETELYVDIILAAADYSNFIEMMKHYKHKIAGGCEGHPDPFQAPPEDEEPAAEEGNDPDYH